MRLPILLVVVLGCGGGEGGDSGVAVTALDNQAQIDLCEQFLTDVCMDPVFASFCDDPCINSGCQAAVENGNVDNECALDPQGAPILDTDVEDCATSGSQSVCMEGGGCMFDALEAACAGG